MVDDYGRVKGVSTQNVIPERLKRFLSDTVHLRSGAGSGAKGKIDVCLVQASDWLSGGDGRTDAPACVSYAVRRFAIRLNDSKLFAARRDLLKPYAPKIVGTNTGKEDEIKRGFIAANFACRIAAPIWFRAAKREDWAAECEALVPITDKITAEAGRDALRKIRTAAAAAHAAATDAAATDAAATDAAAYAAAAYAAATAAATDAAATDAAVYAATVAYTANIGDKLRAASLQCLDDKLRAASLQCLDDLITLKTAA